MQIQVNGDPQQIDGELTIAELIARYELTPQRVAVEVNEQLVTRARFTETTLHDGDRVEIVTLVGGG